MSIDNYLDARQHEYEQKQLENKQKVDRFIEDDPNGAVDVFLERTLNINPIAFNVLWENPHVRDDAEKLYQYILKENEDAVRYAVWDEIQQEDL